MTDRRKSALYLIALLALLILFFSKILFTDKIIRAPDIINELYWTVKDMPNASLTDLFRFNLKADWNMFENSGETTEGGWVAQQFLIHKALLFHFIPAPASVAWFIVFHLFLGGGGAFMYCRAIGIGRLGSMLAGLIFAVAPENASLINAGHVLKIATISIAPWAFFFFEKGFQSRRLVYFVTTAVVLAFQFFHGHWQIAYYTCLGIGVYGVARSVGILLRERSSQKFGFLKLLGMNLVTVIFFLSTVAISLLPLASWSVATTRGASSGANEGRGGLQIDEAMSWSLPPEELATFVIPGFFGFSRQEAGENPANISSYYWGRMHFTQTTDYMGLLPWLLVPLPLIFRRDRYTWLAAGAIAGGILFSIGKYTPFYQLLFDYFPGINRFRVPKMMMFIPVLGLGILAARGVDVLRDETVRGTRAFRRYVLGLMVLPLLLLVLLGILKVGESYWINSFVDILAQPTRYEQGPELVRQRWDNILVETGIAVGVAALFAAVFAAFWKNRLSPRIFPIVLLVLFLADVGRVNAKFMFLVDVPEKSKGVRTPVMEFLLKDSKDYRVMPLNTDPLQYAMEKIPVMFTSHPVQLKRWQDALDSFSFTSVVPDMLNVKYLVLPKDQYEQDKVALGDKFRPVYQSPEGSEIVLENRAVLPKAWLVASVLVQSDPGAILGILNNPSFDPRSMAVVESMPPIAMQPPDRGAPNPPGVARVTHYEGEHVVLSADVTTNSLLVLAEKYYKGWKAVVDGNPVPIQPVNYILRGVYLTPGRHEVEFVFDPIAFKVGKYLTLSSFAIFLILLGREYLTRRGARRKE
ncbi:MAG: YfhO family protein [Geobacter sp.]|nr:YfhO family protein [Geobacter sp.]